jgi:hypothetical protein
VALAEQHEELLVHARDARLEARDHLDLPAPQAGGDLELAELLDALLRVPQRVREAGLREAEHAHGLLPVGGPPRERLAHGVRAHRRAPHRLKLARRAGQHHHRRLAGHHDARGGAHRVDHERSLRDQRLLAVGGTDGVEVPVAEARHEGLQDRGDLVLELLVEHQLTAAEAGHHLDGHVVRGGAEPAARDDQVHALVGEEAQLRLDVLGTVAADRDVGQLNAQLEQAVGQPRPVPVSHTTGEHLRAGHDDARSRAHGLRD